ncbi:esterase/lipase family protein [Streptosporangium roseum]|uniref:esterase/lipase family protein n=1 Tax=Streptosporangium roseum TaxID=2001 RepID=UPI0033316628
MSEQNEQQIAEAFRAAPPIILAPGPQEPPTQLPPPPNDVWDLPGGTAWVYHGEGNHGLTRPVILADGFNTGPSTPDFSWNALDFSAYPLLSELRRRGRDVVLLGFTERSASIMDNSETAIAAVHEAIARRQGDHPLAVGGFSMGGLVTRHALAKLETMKMDHQTALYWSYDSPHRGAWIPIALQAFAHYIRALDSRFSDQMNSPASRQLLGQHIAEWRDSPGVDKERTEFLTELDRVGGWPRIPRLIGVANGVGSGAGNGVKPGLTALKGKGLAITGTDLRTQPAGGDSLVARLRVVTLQRPEIHAPGLPDIDGAPGGTLEGFGILADALNKLARFGFGVDVPIRSHCFVPAVSAVAIRNIDSRDDLYVDIDSLSPDDSELDDFKLASRNEEHTKITEELCTWILDRLP